MPFDTRIHQFKIGLIDWFDMLICIPFLSDSNNDIITDVGWDQ